MSKCLDALDESRNEPQFSVGGDGGNLFQTRSNKRGLCKETVLFGVLDPSLKLLIDTTALQFISIQKS